MLPWKIVKCNRSEMLLLALLRIYIFFSKKSALFKCKMVVFLLLTNQYYLYWLPGHVTPLITILSSPPVAMARSAWYGSVQIWWKRWKACTTPSPCWPLSSRPFDQFISLCTLKAG